jgi:hypothetical protein
MNLITFVEKLLYAVELFKSLLYLMIVLFQKLLNLAKLHFYLWH